MHESDKRDIEEVIHFWFVETTPEQRYAKDSEFDALVKRKFEELYWRVLKGDTKSWRETSAGRLAEVIVLDQFARNMFRGNKQSFVGDEFALSLSREAIEMGDDEKLPQEQKHYLYMPFMHSESHKVHKEALKIFEEKSDRNGLDYEIKHKEIIDRFGRYPHRNKVLERESTPEELEFLKENSGF